MGDSLFSLFAKAIRANNRRETFEATLGDGRNNLNTARTNYVYARVSLPTGVTLTEVLCTRVPKVYGNQVLVAYNVENVLEVIGYSTVKAAAYLSNMPLSTAGQHAWTHQFERGTDKLFVDMRAVGGLQTLPLDTPAQAVYLTPYYYQVGGVTGRYFAGGTVDLSSYFPTGLNQQRPVLVGLNVVTGSTQVVTGTIDHFTGLTRSQMPYGGANVAQITGSTNFYPSAALRLFSSDVVHHYDIFLNMRQWGEFGGIVPLARGGTGADLSATGGANQLVRQNSIGGAFTVSALTQADIPTNAIDNTRLADMAALTVKARTANSSGDPSDLAFSADGHFLVRRSSTLTVGTIVSADLTTALTTPPAIGGTTPAAGSFTTITAAGNLLVSGTGYEIQLSAPAGNFRNFRYMSTISGTPRNRWNLAANSTAESGSNAGSDFAIRAFDDSGNFLVQPILITRATGNILFSSDIEIDGALNHDGATMGFYGATPITKPTINGSRQVNEALQSLLDALESMGLITDSTTA